MKPRAALAEHPFGVIKQRAGMSHFFAVPGKMPRRICRLMVLTYNWTRVLNILGVDALMDYCARKTANRLKTPVYA
ncbi:MAG: hypothetical protein ACRERV_06745 [Methylococcales bacterium]